MGDLGSIPRLGISPGQGTGYPLQCSGLENYLYAEYMMRNARLDESQAGIKIDGRNINPSDMQMTLPLWEKVKRN